MTGGAGGIGRATAELFVAEGASVVMADVGEDRGQEIAVRTGDGVAFGRPMRAMRTGYITPVDSRTRWV